MTAPHVTWRTYNVDVDLPAGAHDGPGHVRRDVNTTLETLPSLPDPPLPQEFLSEGTVLGTAPEKELW